MYGERIFLDEESQTPDALAADKKAADSTKLPPFVYALTAFPGGLNSGMTR